MRALLLLASLASAQPAPERFAIPPDPLSRRPAAGLAEASLTPEERRRNEQSLRWPHGPRSTYAPVVAPSSRRPDPAAEVTGTRWPAPLCLGWYVDETGVERRSMMMDMDIGQSWSDTNGAIARIIGRAAVASPEYVFFRSGAARIIAPSVFAGPRDDFPPFRPGVSRDAPWIYMWQFPLDSPGDDCVSLNVVGGATSGCGDPWQDGIDPANELACHEGRTYLRCHLWCREQVEDVRLGYTNGPCPAPR